MNHPSINPDKNAYSTCKLQMITSHIKIKKMDPAPHTLFPCDERPRLVHCSLSKLVLISAVALLLGLCSARAQINPGIVDPTNSYAGKTYSQLAAGWWQYYMSLPMTNNPLNYIPGNPPVPMSTGQSGPVWFMGGNYFGGGTLSFANTIPSVGLFLLISAIEKDNAA